MRSLSLLLARSRLPSCLATPKSPYDTLDTDRCRRSRASTICTLNSSILPFVFSALDLDLVRLSNKLETSFLRSASCCSARRVSSLAANCRLSSRTSYSAAISSSLSASWCSSSGRSTMISTPDLSPSRPRTCSFVFAVGLYAGKVIMERTDAWRSTAAPELAAAPAAVLDEACVVLFAAVVCMLPPDWLDCSGIPWPASTFWLFRTGSKPLSPSASLVRDSFDRRWARTNKMYVMTINITMPPVTPYL